MKLLATCLLLVVAKDVVAQSRSVHITPVIIGGVGTNINKFPYQLSLQIWGNHICGASVFSRNYALTAAHCVMRFRAPLMTLRAGSSIRQAGGKVYAVEKKTEHPKYTTQLKEYDVAVLKTKTPIEFSATVRPIWLCGEQPSAGSTVTLSGWGVTTFRGEVSQQIQTVSVPVIPESSCKASYSNIINITPKMLCAGLKDKDACQGDSGGPMVYNNCLAGIVSFGYKCAEQGYPGVFTNMADPEVRDFVLRNTV